MGYYVFLNVFSVFLNQPNLYNIFEIMQLQIENSSDFSEYYRLLEKQEKLTKEIENYKTINKKLLSESYNLMDINRTNTNIKNVLVQDIDKITKILDDIKNNKIIPPDIDDEIDKLNYILLLRYIYILYVLIDDYYNSNENKNDDIQNYKFSLINQYILHLIINEYNENINK